MLKYLIGIIVGASLVLMPLGTFSWYVDPFCFFERNTYGMYWNTERYCKETLIKDNPNYDSLLIGNSRTAWIEPDNEFTLNVAFSGATFNEIYVFLEKHLDRDKTVLIGLDYESFYNSQGFKPTDFDKSFVDYMHHLFSYEIISRSYANYFHRNKFKPSIPLGKNGNRVFVDSDLEKANALYRTVLDGSYFRTPFTISYSPVKGAESYARDILSKLNSLLVERNSKYIVFINPIFPAKQRKILRDDIQHIEKVKHFSAVIKEIFPYVLDYSLDHPFVNKRYRDESHFLPGVGAKIIQEARRRISSN
ncbi:MAG: hypothetical protein ACRBEE_07450 [Arenicella sp.]